MIQIKVNFLLVGHTHKDVNQMFSKISTQLRKTGAETQSGKFQKMYFNTGHTIHYNPCMYVTSTTELKRAIEECYTPSPEVKVLEYVHYVNP